MENTEVLTAKIKKEISSNNNKIKIEQKSRVEDKKIMIITPALFGTYLLALPFITKMLSVNPDQILEIYNLSIKANHVVYLVLSVPLTIPLSIFEYSFYKSYKKSEKVLKALDDTNKILEKELDNVKQKEKKEFSIIKDKVNMYYNCHIKEHKYIKLYKKGILNKKLQKKYTYEEITYADEYIEERSKIKVKQV